MVFAGKYFHEKSEGLEEYLRKIAGPAAAEAGKFFYGQNKPVFEISFYGDKYSFIFFIADKEIINSFELDKEFDEHTFHGAVFKTVVKKDGDKFTFSTKLRDGNVTYREFDFSLEGLRVFYSDTKYGVKATSYFKRA